VIEWIGLRFISGGFVMAVAVVILVVYLAYLTWFSDPKEDDEI
jgi:ABC-type transporter Mla subunit MlaD